MNVFFCVYVSVSVHGYVCMCGAITKQDQETWYSFMSLRHYKDAAPMDSQQYGCTDKTV